jgi:hypothetical protein
MNPFVEQAMEPQLREAQRSSEMQRVADQGQATRAGAFGGSRQAIVEAERQRNLGMQQGDIRAKGYQTAFDQAQQNFAREQQMREQSRQYGAGLGMQGLQTALQGAGAMGQLGQTQFGQQKESLGLQQQVGAMQQAQEQQKINQSIQDFANTQQYPLMQLGVMSNMLRGLPMQAATTNQYVAAPNPITQGIGAAGTYASLQNAGVFKSPGGAEGGLPSEFKYAEGGIASVPRYDVGGEVESQLESMDSASLTKQAQESSSPTVRRMAQRILRERQMGIDYQAAQGMAGGGIVAFAAGEKVSDPERERLAAQTAMYVLGAQEAARTRAAEAAGTQPASAPAPAAPASAPASAPAPAASAPAPRAPAPAPAASAPAPARPAPAPRAPAPTRSGVMAASPPVSDVYPDEITRGSAAGLAAPQGIASAPDLAAAAAPGVPSFAGAFADTERQAYLAQQRADRPDADFLREVKAGAPENTAAAEYRRQIMEERANAKDENERQRYMRMAQFFAKWGSTPGPTLAAGLSALEKTIPDILTDEKDQKKAKRELDKVVFDIDNATRLEELGYQKEARALKEKAAERAKDLQHYLVQAKANERNATIQAQASGYAADRRLEGDRLTARESAAGRSQRAAEAADAKKFERLQVAQQQEGRVLNQIAGEADRENHKNDLKTIERYVDADGKVTPGMEARVAEAKERVRLRNEDWERRRTTAANNVDDARKRYTGEAASAPAPAGAPAGAPPANAESVTVGGRTYARPAGMTDAQWSDYKKSQGVK